MNTVLKIYAELFRLLRGLKKLLSLWKRENHIFDVSFGQRLSSLLQGFGPDAAALYDFEKYGREQYLSDLERLGRAVNIDLEYSRVVGNRLFFSDFVSPALRSPVSFGHIVEGRIHPSTAAGLKAEVGRDAINFLRFLLKQQKTVLFKGLYQGSGLELFTVAWTLENGFAINGRQVPDKAVWKRLAGLDNYLITELIGQADYARAVYPASVNSLEILTLVHPENSTVFPVGAVHYFGARSSGLADKLKDGGLAARVSLEKGVITEAFRAAEGEYVPVSIHPDTRAAVTGLTLPGFQNIVWELVKQHQRINYIKALMWKVVIQNDGFIVLGAECQPDLTVQQSFRPLLLDLGPRLFYRLHEVIKR